MRTSARQARLGNQKSETPQPAVTSFGGAAAVFLTLPAVSKKVPKRTVSKEDDRKWLEVAKMCAELVSDDELDITNKTTARDIVSQALSVWASKLCADINLLDSFSIVASLDREAFYLDYDGDESTAGMAFFGLVSDQMTPHINVKQKIEALEKAHPGLGRTAVYYAEMAGYRTFEVLSPSHGFSLAQNLYWMDLDNDEDVKSESGYCGGDELDEDALLPSTYIAAFPEVFLKGVGLEREALRRIASAKDTAGETAKVILSIMDLIEQDAELPDLRMYAVDKAFFSCYMGMDEEHSMLDRVIDDFYQSTGYSEGFTDMYGIADVRLDKEAFLKWRDSMEKGFLLYSKLDRLMGLIGEKQN